MKRLSRPRESIKLTAAQDPRLEIDLSDGIRPHGDGDSSTTNYPEQPVVSTRRSDKRLKRIRALS